MWKMFLNFCVGNSKIFNSDQLQTYFNFCLSHIMGGPRGARDESGSSRRHRKELYALPK